MIVGSMTEMEMMQEIEQDYPCIIAYTDKVTDNRFRRVALKATHYPIYTTYPYTSRRGNLWILCYEAFGKRDVKDKIRLTPAVVYNSARGLYAIIRASIAGKTTLIMLAPHLFERYADRFGSSHTGAGLVSQFLSHNHSFGLTSKLQEDGTTSVYGSTDNGVCIGTLTKEHNILLKTYITWPMAKDAQMEVFGPVDQLRQTKHNKIL